MLLSAQTDAALAAPTQRPDTVVVTLDDARRQIAELQIELSRRPVGDRPIDEVRRQLADTNAALAASRSENAALVARLAEVQEKKARLSAALASAETDLATARASAATRSQELAEARSRIVSLEPAAVELAQVRRTLADVREQKQALAAELGSVQLTNGTLADRLACLERDLAAARTRIAALQPAATELAAVRAELAAARIAKQTLAERVACLETDLTAARTRVTRLEAAAASVPTLTADLGAARARVVELERQKQTGKDRIAALEGELVSARLRIRSLETQIAHHRPLSGRPVVVSRID